MHDADGIATLYQAIRTEAVDLHKTLILVGGIQILLLALILWRLW
jgi:hypothetical protein